MRYEAMAAPANENAAEAGATINFGSISDGGFLLNLLQKGSRLEKDKDKNSHAKPSKQEQEQQQQQQNSDEVTNFHDPAVAALGPSHPLYQSQSQSQSSPHGSHSPWISARVSGFPNPATSTTIEQGLIAAGQGLENSSFLPFHANGVVPAPSPALTQNLQMAFPVPLNMGPASHMGFSVPHGFPMNMQQHPPTNMQSPFFADEKFGGAPTAFAVSGFPQQQPFNFTGGFGYQDHFPNSEPRRFEYNGYLESSVQTETGSAATSSVKGPTTVYQDNVRRDKLGKGPMTVHQENVGRDRSGKQVGAQQKGNKEVKNKDKVQGSFRLLKRPPSNEQVSNAGSAPTTTHSAKHGLQSGSRSRTTNQAQEHLHACQNQHASVSVIIDNLDSVRLNEMDNGKALLQNHWESKAMHAMPMGLDRNQHKVALANGKHIGIVDRRQRQYQYREVGGYNRYTSKEGRVASRERNMAQGSAVDHNQQRKNWNTGFQVAEDADFTENQRNSQAIQKNDSQPRRVRVNETESSSRQNYQEQVRRLRKRVFRYRDDIEVFTPRFLSIYESLTPGEDEETKRMELIFRLEKVIQRKWPQSELHLFGSCANSFGVSKSDIDVCLSIDEDESNKPKLVKKLAEILEAEDMKNVQALTRARVPIVKFTDPVTAISCDICINNILAVENTKLLHDYAQIDIRLQQLAFVVKHWAKSRQINETYQGTLSSYAYVLMCIHFLQQRKPAILPCLQKMEATYRVTVGKVECTYYDQVENLKDYSAQNRETLGQLLSAFFDYWAFRHDYTSSVISVRTGGFLSKEFKNWTTRIGNERHLICIEDPFEIDHDLGRVVDKHSICVLRQEFLRAAEIMQQDPDPAATLFLPCDPRC